MVHMVLPCSLMQSWSVQDQVMMIANIYEIKVPIKRARYKKCRSMGSISRSIRVVYSSAMPKYARLRGCARCTRRRICHEKGRQKNARSSVTQKLSDSLPFRSFNNITISTCIGATAVYKKRE
uniref:Uncharacterized protein n=1 Tax=Trichogramma kaykai TaxID=54128 RepID=A0ABD2W840_9HYME